MLDHVDIFQVTLTVTVDWEFVKEISDLVCVERDKAIDRAEKLLESLDFEKYAYYDSIAVSVKAGVLGMTGFETEIYVQRLLPELAMQDSYEKAQEASRAEQAHDFTLESIIKEAQMSRHVVKGFGHLDLSLL